jgi:hypothetical protein
MKQVIRHSVFETNSSSTHTLTICSDDEYERFKRGELYQNESYSECFKGLPEFCTKEQILEAKDTYNKSNNIKTVMEDEDFSDEFTSFDDYVEKQNDGAEDSFHKTYVTKSGDKVVVFGWYGHD